MLLLFQATATQVADSPQVVADKLMKEAIANADGLDKLSLITQQLMDFAIRAGETYLDCGHRLYCRTFPYFNAQPLCRTVSWIEEKWISVSRLSSKVW